MHVLLLLGLSLLLSWPLLVHGAPDLSHNAVDYARWAKDFATQFWHGDLYPRWFTNENGGFGGPTGFFYPPLSSYVSTVFWPLMAAWDPQGWRVTGYSMALAQMLSAITAYLWLRSFTKPAAALLGALVYDIAPYHLAIDVYQRGAAPELWVFVWFPLVLLSAEGLLRRHRWAFPAVTVSYALAVLSHPTVSACFAPIPAAYVFFFSAAKDRLKATAMIAAALLLGVGLNAEYLLPAMLDQPKAYATSQTVGVHDFHYHWVLRAGDISVISQYAQAAVTGKANHAPRITFRLRVLEVTLATLVAILVLYLLVRRLEKTARLGRIALFYFSVAIVSFFFMNKLSVLIWEKAPFVKLLQYPFRFNVILVVSLSALAALAVPFLLQRRAWLVTLFLSVVAASWLWVDARSPAQEFSAMQAVAPNRTERVRQSARTQIDYPTTWPRPGNLNALNDVSAFDRLVAAHPPQTAQLEALVPGEAAGTALVESWQPRRVVLRIEAPQASELTLNHFYYAGWQAHIDGAGITLAVSPSPDGLMQMPVPSGTYDAIVELPLDGAERTGRMVSLLSLVLLGWATVYPIFRHRWLSQPVKKGSL